MSTSIGFCIQNNHQREYATDASGEVSGPRVAPHSHREQRAQHASTVHRERRQHVEQREHDVHPNELRDEASRRECVADGVHLLLRHAAGQSQQTVEQGGEHEVHRRAGERDDQLLPRYAWHSLQPRHTADRQEGDVPSVNAVSARRERMPQLMQHDDRKERHDVEQQRGEHCCEPALELLQRDPAEQEQEGGMHIERNAGHASDSPGPLHASIPVPVTVFPGADSSNRGSATRT
jgi:hypothetical protein